MSGGDVEAQSGFRTAGCNILYTESGKHAYEFETRVLRNAQNGALLLLKERKGRLCPEVCGRYRYVRGP